MQHNHFPCEFECPYLNESVNLLFYLRDHIRTYINSMDTSNYKVQSK